MPEQQKKQQSPAIMIMLFVLMLMILVDPSFREGAASVTGLLLYPLIGFGSHYPIMTIFLAGLFTATFSTIVRHFFTDWKAMARMQERNKYLSKEMREARLSNNQARLNQINKLRMDMMKEQSTATTSQFKSMPLTMLVIIPVFTWLWQFMSKLPSHTFSVPWAASVDLNIGSVCWLPNWLILYSLLSIPFSQVIMRALKTVSLGKAAPEDGVLPSESDRDRLSRLEEEVMALESEGLDPARAAELVDRAKTAWKDGDTVEMRAHMNEADKELSNVRKRHMKVLESVEEAREELEEARGEGLSTENADKALDKAENALQKEDYSTALYYAKQVKRELRALRTSREKLEKDLEHAEELLQDASEDKIPITEAETKLSEARRCLDRGDTDQVQVLVEEATTMLEESRRLKAEADDALESARRMLKEMREAGRDVDAQGEQVGRAEEALHTADFTEAKDLAKGAMEDMKTLKDWENRAEEAVSMAKLVISNAQSFGASVQDAEGRLAKAEEALAGSDYRSATDMAHAAREAAESAKAEAVKASKGR